MELLEEHKEEKTSTKENINHTPEQLLSTFLIDGIRYKTKKIGNSVEEGKKLGLNIKTPVDIYYLDGNGGLIQGAYYDKKNIIFMFDNADRITLKHEIIHSLEFNKPVPDELYEFYEIVKNSITEESFDDGMVSFNFMKNIHEFIADGYSKSPFIKALKKEGLYEEFLEKTKYIFE